jgi:protein-disulfide isomerase
VVAAKAALAANRLDPQRYPDFHFALMQSRELSREAVLKVAAAQGYDEEALAREMEAGWVAAHIEATRSLAEKLGINGTPSFVIGDTLIPGAVEVSELANRINAALERVN